MLRTNKITALQMYFVLILSIGISNHVQLIPVLLQIGRRDAWAGAVGAVLPLIAWAGIVGITARRIGSRKTTEWLKQRCGTPIALFFIVVFSLYFMVISIVSLKDTITWTQVSYLPQTPQTVTCVTFMLLCFFAAKAGLRAIAITSGLLLPIVVVLGIFVMSVNFQYKDYTLLAPLFTHGYEPALKSAVFACGGMFELTIILFMQHQLSSPIKFSALVWLSMFLVILTAGPLTGAISIYGPFQAAELRYPAFEQWRMVQVGKFISHLDFFSIYQWISGAFVRISLMIYLISELLEIRRPRIKNIVLLSLSALPAAFILIPLSDISFFQLLLHWYYPLSLGLNFSMLLLLFILAIVPVRPKEIRTT